MLIPVARTDSGIKLCLDNARRILNSVQILYNHEDWTLTLNHAIVLYYYAFEEFGKAIKLKEDKDNAIENSETNIVVNW